MLYQTHDGMQYSDKLIRKMTMGNNAPIGLQKYISLALFETFLLDKYSELCAKATRKKDSVVLSRAISFLEKFEIVRDNHDNPAVVHAAAKFVWFVILKN